MKKFEKKMQEVPVCTAVICDKCGKEIKSDDTMQIQEVLSIRVCPGYSSCLGDGSDLRCDLCDSCVKEVLGAYFKEYAYAEPFDLSEEETPQDWKCPNCGCKEAWFDRSITIDAEGNEIDGMGYVCNQCGRKQ